MITINGKTYKSAEMNFANVCRLEQLGVPLQEIENRPLTAVCAFAAVCMNTTLEKATAEVEAHILGDGDLSEIMTAFRESVERSGFFAKLREKKETANVTEMPKK